MTTEEHKEFKKLKRQVQERHRKLFDQGSGGRIKSRKPNAFNNKLKELQDHLRKCGLEHNFPHRRWFSIEPLK